MPRGDGTGPRGQGPMTGKGMGYCDPNQLARRYEGTKEDLKKQKTQLEKELKEINNLLKE